MTNNDITHLITLNNKFLKQQLTNTQFAWEIQGWMSQIIKYCQKGIDAEREEMYPDASTGDYRDPILPTTTVIQSPTPPTLDSLHSLFTYYDLS